MGVYCNYCGSTNVSGPFVSPPPRNITYWHCNNCNRNTVNPILDFAPTVIDEDAENGSPPEEKNG